MIYYYEAELEAIKKISPEYVDINILLDWLVLNKKSNKYLEITFLTRLGQIWLTVVYGKNNLSTQKIAVDVSYLGTQIKES